MKNHDICDVKCIHLDAVVEVSHNMPDQMTCDRLACLFKALGDQTRIKIIHALSQHELCVCDLQAILQMSQSAISHQLRTLRNLNLVKYHRKGKMVYYSLDDEHVRNLFSEGLDHIKHQ